MILNKKKTILTIVFSNGAGSGNRTHLSSLEGWSITDIRYPHIFLIIINFVLLRQFRHCAPHLYYISSGAPSSFPCTTRS